MPRIDELTPGERRRFRTGRPALDFTHTGGEGEYAVWEIVHTADDLGRWLGVMLDLPGDVVASVADLPAARALRAALTRIARGLATGTPPAAGDVAALNAAAAAPPLVPVWRPGGGVTWLAPRGGPPTAAAALATLARDGVDLFAGPLASRIRICAAQDCGLLFVDASRPGTRRWCSMQRCGTLAKVRRHRTRPA